jgi:lysophospholipase L1-like esterase
VLLTGGPEVLENPAFLYPFFDRLGAFERGEKQQVRILWLGDSHVAADLLSGHARRLLQARFGDGGAGLVMPGNPWRYFHHDRARSSGDGGFETIGLGRDVVDPLVGLWGLALSPRGEGSASLGAAFAEAEVVALAPSGEGCLSVSVDGVTAFGGDLGKAVDGTSTPCARIDGAILRNGAVVAFIGTADAGDVPRTLAVRDACGGEVRVLGADLRSGRPGILVDSVGINGAEIGWLGRPDRELRRVLLERLDPALVVVSFGTNDMGRPDLLPEEFEAAATDLLRALREDAPEAAILVAGPLDRESRSMRTSRLLSVNEPAVIRALRSAARTSGAAFVDQRALMGGDGSIRTWVRRGLAARDLVHLSRRGYERVADRLVDGLLRAYAARHGTEGAR